MAMPKARIFITSMEQPAIVMVDKAEADLRAEAAVTGARQMQPLAELLSGLERSDAI